MLAIASEAQAREFDLHPGRPAQPHDTPGTGVLHPAEHPTGGPARLRPSASLGGRATLQRCACGGACCDPGDKAPTYAPSVAMSAISRPGRPLDPSVRASLEPRLGADLGGVRIHDDSGAAAAADAVDARAYTIGQHVVFARGQYSPSTAGGQRLLAHELAHTIQQKSTPETGPEVQISRSDDPLEHDADLAAAHATAPLGAPSRTRPMARSGRALARQGGGRSHPADPVEEARAIAWGMVFKAYARLTGVGPPPAPGLEGEAQLHQATEQLELRNLARKIFNWNNPNMDQITEIVGHMRDWLGPGLKTVKTAPGDKLCGNRRAYVTGHAPPIHLCPPFFTSSRDVQAETLVHEAAHLAGIGQPDPESYCIVFDCESSCGGFGAADSWAHFIHCASGRAPQKP